MTKNPQLGIYFSYNFINIVEQQDSRVFNFAKVPCIFEESKFDLSRVVIDEVKIVNLIKEELSKNNIINRGAILALLSRDIIIRFFEVPIVPRAEIEPTIGFEARKYIPFKLEELIFDFKFSIDKANKKIAVIFVAVKRDLLEKYISILEQAGFNIIAIEPVFLSVLRVLKLTKKIEAKHPVAIIDVDFKAERGEITVIENFYPRFSRELNLQLQAEKEAPSKEDILDKLIKEIRISLDYCRRQFSSNPININKLVLLSNDGLAESVDALSKELEIPAASLDLKANIVSADKNFDLELTKAYGASLSDAISFPLKIDLFARIKSAGAAKEDLDEGIIKKVFLEIDKIFIIKNMLVLLLVVFIVYLSGFTQIKAYDSKLKKAGEISEMLSSIPGIKSTTYPELKKVEEEYNKKIFLVNNMTENKIWFVRNLSALAKLREKGLWITNIDFQDNDRMRRLALQGSVYLGNEQEEFAALDRFLSKLKKDASFVNFKSISLGSFSRRAVAGEPDKEGYSVSNFDVTCE